MSMGRSHEAFETAEGHSHPLCRQLTVFLENRVGQLLRLTRLFDADETRILGISVDAKTDCSIVRLLVDNPDIARERLTDAGFPVAENEILVVELPPGKRGILTVCAALISGEININYLYPLLAGESRDACLVIQADDIQRAAEVLHARKFRVIHESEL